MNYGKGAIIFMRYISTRGGLEEKLSAEAIKQGLAADGGLFVPDTIPELSMTEIQELVNMDYATRAARILSKFLTDYTYEELLQASQEAYSEQRFGNAAAPLYSLDEQNRVLELWHGPTCAFKDMALQIMPRL